MKRAQSLLHASLLAMSIVFLTSRIATQDKAHLPTELSQSASLSEIVDWLDKTSFPDARVGLKSSDSQGLPSSTNPDWQEGTPGHSLVFSQGFRLSGIDGCTLTLRNEDTYLINSSKNIRNSGTHTAAELSVQLDRLSSTKGKVTYRHTKNFEKAALVGAWRTEYRYKGFTKHTVVGLELFSTKSKEKVGFWDGTTLTFTFDSKEMSEKFDAAFRQAIRLCTMK